MIGKLYIDGEDPYIKYGVFVLSGGYNELVSFPPLKKVDTIDWAENDGIEVDLSNPTLDTREFNISFASHNEVKTGAFIALLSAGAYHTFNFTEIDRTYKLRMSSMPRLETDSRLDFFTIQFADDFPLPNYSYAAPQNTMQTPATGYEVDDVDLCEYNISVLQGSLDDALQLPAVKQNLLRNIGSCNGAIYDDTWVNYQAKNVKLACLMQAKTTGELWRNYNALLFNLTRPNQRSIYIEKIGLNYPCYYKNSNVSEFFASGKIWLKFSLTLTLTSYRLEADEYILASEGETWITTEDDLAINLNI